MDITLYYFQVLASDLTLRFINSPYFVKNKAVQIPCLKGCLMAYLAAKCVQSPGCKEKFSYLNTEVVIDFSSIYTSFISLKDRSQ